jgi:hypothetical protein
MFPFFVIPLLEVKPGPFRRFSHHFVVFRLGFSFIVLHHFASILMFRFIAPSFHRKTFFSSYFHKHFCEFISILAKIASKKLRKGRKFSLRYETIEFSTCKREDPTRFFTSFIFSVKHLLLISLGMIFSATTV